ncbi:hypothetical protein CR513_12258, partial [Mucuna pruriens]
MLQSLDPLFPFSRSHLLRSQWCTVISLVLLSIEEVQVARGDRLDYQLTLVDLILNVLASGGEPSSSTMAIIVEDGVTEIQALLRQSQSDSVASVALSRDRVGQGFSESISNQSLPRASRHSTLKSFSFTSNTTKTALIIPLEEAERKAETDLVDATSLRIRDKKGVKNAIVDHLSRLEREAEPIPIRDKFLDEQILQMTHVSPWYANICYYLVASTYP